MPSKTERTEPLRLPSGQSVFSLPGWRLIDLSGVIVDPGPDVPEEERY